MKKVITSFCVLYFMFGYNNIGFGGWLSDVTDAAKTVSGKSSTAPNKSNDGVAAQNRERAEVKILNSIKHDLATYETPNRLRPEREIIEKYICDEYKAKLKSAKFTQPQIDEAVAKHQDDIKALASSHLEKLNKKRNEEITKKVSDALGYIKEKMRLGEAVDVEKDFKGRLLSLNGLKSEEINKAVADNRQQLDELIAERKLGMDKLQKTKFSEAWKLFISLINNQDFGSEEIMRQYQLALKPYFSQEQINDELKKQLENIKYTNAKFFASRVKLYKDINSGISYAWMLGSWNSNLKSEPVIYNNAFLATAASGSDGVNNLAFLFSNGKELLPQMQFSAAEIRYGIANIHGRTANLSESELFATIVTFGKGISFEDVLKKNESIYGAFKNTTTKESIILEPFAFKTPFTYKTATFEDDNIRIEIQQLTHCGEEVEKLSKLLPDYQKWVKELLVKYQSQYQGRNVIIHKEKLVSPDEMYEIKPSKEEIKEKIEQIIGQNPVKMSVYDMKRVKKLNALYQEELNALNTKRQANEKAAQDKADQAKKDALSF